MEALVSAAVGLAIAIPVVVMYGCLRNRVDRVVSELEAAATAIIGHITARNKAKDVAKCEEN
jgi:biopolymer transport protein ExbB/TolQ